MRSTVNIMTTLRSDEGRIRFRFVVDQSCFSSLHCPESSLFPRPTQTSVESVRGLFRKCMGLIPESVWGSFGKGTGLIRKGYGAHSERVRGSFRKENAKESCSWSFTTLQKRGQECVMFQHTSRTASCPRWLSKHSSLFANTLSSCNNIYAEESRKSRGGTFKPIVPNRKNT
jgi:hypothetical protein